jgi:S-adenosylmethionine:tRNA ribosyltransferase-isomerase
MALGALRREWAGQFPYHCEVHRHDFAYHLPPELIAQTPLPERSASRLLVVERSGDRAARVGAASAPRESAASDSAACDSSPNLRDCTMREFPDLLRPGDLLVFNDTRVVAARLLGTKPSGGRVEIFLERAIGTHEALVQLRASKPIREGLEVTTAGGVVRVLGRQGDLWRTEYPEPALDFFERWGDVPLPPYIHRAPDANDRERYQSVFARERGAVAAPTASLHFDSRLIRDVEARGAKRAFITLHVGAGTFQPLRTDDLESHVMHAERVSVSTETWRTINETRKAGGRVIAVGTTVVRALESAALEMRECGASDWSGETKLFIRPGFTFRSTDALLTNFHLPESTLLMLVCAFAGKERVLAAYEHAVRAQYRFFSYGDAMFLTRPQVLG